jgi:Tol biopolymer transport system component
MNPDGSRARRINHEPADQGSGFGSYSPDGRRIVFISDNPTGPGAAVFTMNGNGLNAAPIVTDHAHIFFTDWGPNTSTATPSR